MTRIAIIVGTRGRGSNMQAIIEACNGGRLEASVSLVLSPSAESPALHAAKALGCKTASCAPADFLELLRREKIDLICLAGFMKLLPAEVVREFNGSVLNIHPALLPKFGGKGMYGRHVHKAVLESGDTESGCTVHYVDERYDEGAILHQIRCDVHPDDTPETLAERILPLEHRCYVEAIDTWIYLRQSGRKAST